MTRKQQQSPSAGARRFFGVTLALTVGVMGGCDGLLEVELPGQITEAALYDPTQALTLVNSAMADIECAYSAFIASNSSGNEDVFVRTTGWWGSLEYQPQPNLNQCNSSDTNVGWWIPLQAGRYQAEVTYAKIGEWGTQVGAQKDRLLAQSAIYAGISYDLMGEYMCEVAIDGGPLLTPDQTLARSEEWLTKAIGHIGSTDFAIAGGVSSSAQQMAYALRARVRWARGNNAGAVADAGRVTKGFKAYATRDSGGERTRWNRTFEAMNGSGWATVSPPVDWWTGPGDWPKVIPFTGYRDLGILADGRAVTATRHPITTATAGAVADSRVPVANQNRIFNGFPVWHQRKYADMGADVPLANWEEIWLILAEIEGGQKAIDRVNEIRDFHKLPLVTYLSAGDAAGIKDLIIEERRRSLFLEGRFWATKMRENLWFPRGSGRTPYPYTYQTAVRMTMADREFELNPNLKLDQRGSLCGNQRPIL